MERFVALKCRRNIFLYLSVALMTLSSLTSSAKIGRFESYLTLQSQYSSYNDLQLNSGTGATLSPSLDVELSYKFFRAFYFSLVGSQATDNTRTGFGFGARVDLPGIFFFGSRRGSFRQRSKKFPVNTSAYIHSMLTDHQAADSTQKKTVTSRYGFTLELFIFNEITYVSLDASLFTIDGNSFVTYATGFGLEF